MSRADSTLSNVRIFLYILITGIMALFGFSNLVLLFTVLIFAWFLRYTLKHISDSIYMFCFLLCFFTFALGGQIVSKLMGAYSYVFTDEVELYANICLYISLVGLIAGFFFSRKVVFTTFKKPIEKKSIDYNSHEYTTIRKLSRNAFYLLYALWMYILADRIVYVARHGYTSYYLGYTTSVNVIIRYIGIMAPSAFFLFLATMPTKKEVKIPVILYTLYLVASLGTGRRIYIMTGVLIVFAYYCCRNYINPGNTPWISKRQLLRILLLVPILLGFMYLFEYIRSEYYYGNISAYNPLIGFFVRQGTSINVIKFAKFYIDDLDPNTKYSLSNLVRRIQNSPLNAFFNYNYVFGKQSVETALYGNSLADFLSYKINKYSYLNGMGWGSSYIAELYVDFGYFGVFVGNFIYGVLLNGILKATLRLSNVWLTACGFLIVDSLFKAPRAQFDSFLGQFIYFNDWGFILIVYVIVRLMKSRRQRYIRRSYIRGD